MDLVIVLVNKYGGKNLKAGRDIAVVVCVAGGSYGDRIQE